MITSLNNELIVDTTGARRVPAQYAPRRPSGPIDLFLDANEGRFAGIDMLTLAASVGTEGVRRYPSAANLERAIGEKLGIRASSVLVTAGGDEAIDRACRAFLQAGSELILPVPTFEMIGRFASLAGATVVSPAWPSGPYPTAAVIDRVSDGAAMIAVVSPNNPTGAVATARDLERLAEAAPRAILLVDLAYTEFADEDLTAAALSLPNAVIIRSFSKAYGLAGLRVGYAAGREELVRAMRASGTPFSAGAFSLAAADAALKEGAAVGRAVAVVRHERAELGRILQGVGVLPIESQANFVLAEFDDAGWVWRALAGLGIAVRRFDEGSGLERSLRITCPANARAFERLCGAIRAAVRPQALLFDMDGVLSDVSRSYRRAIAVTAASFGVRVNPAEVAAAKAEPDSNNDWIVTQRLLGRAGVAAGLEEVTRRFERIYQGTEQVPGLERDETLIPARDLLERLGSRMRLGIVTGRPRRAAERFLTRFELARLFDVVVCLEDGPSKPDPAPVRLALSRLGVPTAWMVGDTPDDLAAARAAGVVPLGIGAPGDDRTVSATRLEAAGASQVLSSLSELEGMLP